MNIETIDVDPDFKSVGQAAVAVVDKAGKAMAERHVAPSDPMQMAFALIQSGADSASVKELLAISREISSERAKSEFNEAMSAAKSEIPTIGKNATGHNNKRYADFSAYDAALKPILARHGLSYRFRSRQDAGLITVTCIISHRAGHSEENELSGGPDTSGSKNPIQAVGSTISYLMRYSLILALGLASAEDDDGKASGGGERVSDEQRDRILGLIDEIGIDLPGFCRFMKVEAVGDIAAKDYDKAVQALEAKRRKAS